MIDLNDDQQGLLAVFQQAWREEKLNCFAATDKETGEVCMLLVVFDSNSTEDQVDFLPIGLLFNPGEDVFGKYDFDIELEDDDEVIYEKPSLWDKFFRRKK